ncbi:MAG: hypothetical protein RLY31_1544 [Bacteroidota bacterium]
MLLQIKAIKLSPHAPFTWASGIKSPIYCDNRLVLSNPDARNLIKRCMVEKSAVFQPFSAVAGVATAGIAHGVLLADALSLPFAYVRSKAKEHGRQNMLEGELSPGTDVLVVEDLVSTGGSSLAAVQALRDAGHHVVGVLAIFSYQFEQALSAFEAAECPLHTLSGYDVLLKEALATHYIQPGDMDMLNAWRQSQGRQA